MSKVYILVKCVEQDTFVNCYGDEAVESSEIIDAYDDYDVAYTASVQLEEEAKRNNEECEDIENCYFKIEERNILNYQEMLLKRYEKAMSKLPFDILMNLPEDKKAVLKNTTNLQDKVLLLEDIVSHREKG